ncbi:hypothetical protein B9Z41_08750 [Limnohabitans sp. JirII-31]|nr:hypothetical protein B9Z41_08750 [Limnohabitans sp. JirII-31]
MPFMLIMAWVAKSSRTCPLTLKAVFKQAVACTMAQVCPELHGDARVISKRNSCPVGDKLAKVVAISGTPSNVAACKAANVGVKEAVFAYAVNPLTFRIRYLCNPTDAATI